VGAAGVAEAEEVVGADEAETAEVDEADAGEAEEAENGTEETGAEEDGCLANLSRET
jgi:hypothetical protein